VEIRFSLRLPRDAASVPLARALVRDAMRVLRVTEECTADIALAVTEACANVVLHADGDAREYDLEISVQDDRCHMRVVDRGAGLGAGDADRPMPPPGEDHGRGIALMRMLVDRLSFVSEPERGTVVHLEKQLHLEPGSPLLVLSAA
jgi:serine/threonine-protein kinase RsbW